MNNILLRIFILLFLPGALLSQDFTWKKGSTSGGQPGKYGNIGIPTATNVPGARKSGTCWKDLNGNFWMFGGEGHDYISNQGFLSDLWRYNPVTNEWTFMVGNDIIAQSTGYGTLGVSSPNNKPGGRFGATSWTDASGALWMFGGYGYDASAGIVYLSDLWKYNVASNEWTWMNGSNFGNQPGDHGTLGTPAPSNIPGGRHGSSGWTDNSGNLWLFGGFGIATTTNNIGQLSDLWKYNTATNQWTWMKGSSTENQNGVYGTLGSPAPGNLPGGRSYASAWYDPAGSLWLMGGEGYDGTLTTSGSLNDLWKYDLTSAEWTWVKGANAVNQNGIYGTIGVSNPVNVPGSRLGSMTWTDAAGSLWLFGGKGYPLTGAPGSLNDLWKYDKTANEWMWVKSTAVTNQTGTYGSQNIPAPANRPGGRFLSCTWTGPNNNLYLFGGEGFAATGPVDQLNDLWKYTNCFISPITMTIVSQDSLICAGESTSLTVTGSDNYLWLSNLSTNSYLVIKPTNTTTYSVSTSDSNGCIYTAGFTQSVDACAGISSETFYHAYKIFPNPSSGSIYVEGKMDGSISVYDLTGVLILKKEITGKTELTGLNPGIYFYEITSENNLSRNGKLLVE